LEERVESLVVARSVITAPGSVPEPGSWPGEKRREKFMKTDQRQKILFLSTDNSARSIFAEYFIEKIAGDRFEAYSAGSQPTEAIHPFVLQLLRDHYHIDPSGARSKSWEEFRDTRFDIIITVCDRARESCPLFPGQPTIAYWNIPDPAEATGTEAEKLRKYRDVAQQIQQRIHLLCAFPLEKLGHLVPSRVEDANSDA
jgi:arsenate reductase